MVPGNPFQKPDNFMPLVIKFIQHFLSLITSKHHRVHTDCPIIVYEDSVWLDEEHLPESDNGHKGHDGYRGSI